MDTEERILWASFLIISTRLTKQEAGPFVEPGEWELHRGLEQTVEPVVLAGVSPPVHVLRLQCRTLISLFVTLREPQSFQFSKLRDWQRTDDKTSLPTEVLWGLWSVMMSLSYTRMSFWKDAAGSLSQSKEK